MPLFNFYYLTKITVSFCLLPAIYALLRVTEQIYSIHFFSWWVVDVKRFYNFFNCNATAPCVKEDSGLRTGVARAGSIDPSVLVCQTPAGALVPRSPWSMAAPCGIPRCRPLPCLQTCHKKSSDQLINSYSNSLLYTAHWECNNRGYMNVSTQMC